MLPNFYLHLGIPFISYFSLRHLNLLITIVKHYPSSNWEATHRKSSSNASPTSCLECLNFDRTAKPTWNNSMATGDQVDQPHHQSITVLSKRILSVVLRSLRKLTVIYLFNIFSFDVLACYINNNWPTSQVYIL